MRERIPEDFNQNIKLDKQVQSISCVVEASGSGNIIRSAVRGIKGHFETFEGAYP
jgi:hypothetical protein